MLINKSILTKDNVCGVCVCFRFTVMNRTHGSDIMCPGVTRSQYFKF